MTDIPAKKSEDAAAMQDGKKPGPKTSPVQVRDAGKDETGQQRHQRNGHQIVADGPPAQRWKS